MPLDEHPVQSFCWGDYTVKPGTAYTYRVTPMYGHPKLLKPRPNPTTSVDVTTEAETDPASNGDGGVRHDVHSNRGVIGSQAYALKFGTRRCSSSSRAARARSTRSAARSTGPSSTR